MIRLSVRLISARDARASERFLKKIPVLKQQTMNGTNNISFHIILHENEKVYIVSFDCALWNCWCNTIESFTYFYSVLLSVITQEKGNQYRNLYLLIWKFYAHIFNSEFNFFSLFLECSLYFMDLPASLNRSFMTHLILLTSSAWCFWMNICMPLIYLYCLQFEQSWVSLGLSLALLIQWR